MKIMMPQEVEVWYLIPSIRKELAKIIVNNYAFSQKNAAKILGITEGAVSQYLSKKRGANFRFNEEDIEKIKRAAKKIVENKSNVIHEMNELCIEFRRSKTLCAVHKSTDELISKECDICFR